MITQEGLSAVKKLLRKTATKNTAVSCHWIRSRARSEFVWAVGNKNKFNEQGFVPVNITELDMSQFKDTNQWKTIKLIEYTAAIAGLFHDFGKANTLFQQKLQPGYKGDKYEPYRHEWVSLRLFEALVRGKSDESWLETLSLSDSTSLDQAFDVVTKDGIDKEIMNNPLVGLTPYAQLVGWLILTHHKLPLYPIWKEKLPPSLSEESNWFESNFEPFWNSNNCKDLEITNDQLKKNWTYRYGLPVVSMQWRSKICLLAAEALSVLHSFSQSVVPENWLNEQIFTSHMARLCLMLADHHYSSLSATPKWQNPNYGACANTDKTSKQPKQKLDEHLIGLAHHAAKIAKALPKLNSTLRSLDSPTTLTDNVKKSFKKDFGWQDKARQLTIKIGQSTITQGFFGINMASTGKGKTLANAKIMYGLGDEIGRRRFSVALGLRTLTLQTGREYREKIGLTDDELAILVGGIAVKDLADFNEDKTRKMVEQAKEEDLQWSESKSPLLNDDVHLSYKGDLYQHSLSDWVNPTNIEGDYSDSRIDKLIQSPVLVSTIDYLIPASEGIRGGKQIGPMLRLLTSDLVLDEPDDFGLDDLPALCRLVYWAAMLGSKVLLSSATIPPALAYGLYQAYQAGWEQFSHANNPDWNKEITCAWFDEFSCDSEAFSEFSSFKLKHGKFVKSRIKELKKASNPKRKGQIFEIETICDVPIEKTLADAVRQGILKLHKNHHQSNSGKNVSIGLVRMANINPLVAVAKELLQIETPEDTCIHYCVYHSHYPLAIRSHLESNLDTILCRKEPEKIWHQDSIELAVNKYKQSNHIFVVLASPVAEVGRDHDYDWAIVEPSSMRSIIQLAGRVLRHRQKIPETPNILLLSKNFKALGSKHDICFIRPGFESKQLKMSSYDLKEILKPEQFETIDATTRITLPDPYKLDNDRYKNLIELEHKALAECLFLKDGKGTPHAANVWWNSSPQWCGEVQRQQRFRNSKQDEAYYLFLKSEYTEPFWQWKNESVYPQDFGEGAIRIELKNDLIKSEGNYFWFNLDTTKIYLDLSQHFNIDLITVSKRFGEVRLVNYNNNCSEYYYHPMLGVYDEI